MQEFLQEGYLLTENDELELSVACSNIMAENQAFHIYPLIRFYIEKKGSFHLYDQTETSKGRNPQFSHKFIMPYTYEWSRKFRFELVDHRNSEEVLFLAQSVISLKELITAKQRKIKVNMSNLTHKICELEITWNIPKNSCKYLKLTTELVELNESKGWLFKKQRTFTYKLGRYAFFDDFVKVYQSESVPDTKPIVWKPAEFRATTLCLDDLSRPIKLKLSCTENQQERLVGETFFSIHEILHGKNQFVLADSDMQKSLGKVQFQVEMIEKCNALDYLRAGLQFNFLLAIDYTDSHLNSHDSPSENFTKFNPTFSNHLADKEGETKYSQALKQIVPILMNYSKDKKIAMYGFGGKPEFEKSSQENQSCFSLTGDPNNPWVDGLEGALNTYKASIDQVSRGGPKNFGDIFMKGALSAKYNRLLGFKEFTIVVIFTEGGISDMKETLDVVDSSGDLPIMFMIVGVGESDFENMEILDGDDAARYKKGKDIVKFLGLEEYKHYQHLIPYELLRKLPVQIDSYMHHHNVKLSAFDKEISPDMKSLLELRDRVYGTSLSVKECENEIKEATRSILAQRKKKSNFAK